MNQTIVQLNRNLDGKLLCQGNTAEIFLYDEGKILKLFRDGFPFDVIASEFDISKRIASDLTFVPKVFELVQYQNRYGIVYEKIDGKDMIAKMLRKPYKINAYSKALAEAHAKIHRSTVNLGIDIKTSLKNNINATTDLSESEKEKIKSHLEALPDGNSLCHFDFHPGNVMIKADKFYVIDWMT
ncbi:MAG: phosphotransferase, partial [Clostridia bacterium]|nr:phosphotransferase [Clostridia bacterium]